MSNYVLDPDTPSLISFSGGRTSGYMLYKIYEANGGIPDNCYVVFANTGKERPETLDFIHAIECDLNIKIYWLEYISNKVRYVEVNCASASTKGEPFQALNRHTTGLPHPRQRSCTGELKVKVMHRFMKDKIGAKTEFQSIIGIRYDEPKRFKVEDNDQNKYCENVIPLRYEKVTEKDVLEFWDNKHFNLKLDIGESNCDLCYLKGGKLLISMIEKNPKLADWWIKQEAFSCGNNGKKAVSRRFRNDRPSYAELKQIAVNQNSFDFGDNDLTQPCNCHD